MIPLTSHTPRLRQDVSPLKPIWHGKTTQIPMALLHHQRTWPLLSPSLNGTFPYIHLNVLTGHTSESQLCKRPFPVLLLYYKLATSESSSEHALSRTAFVLQTGHF